MLVGRTAFFAHAAARTTAPASHHRLHDDTHNARTRLRLAQTFPEELLQETLKVAERCRCAG